MISFQGGFEVVYFKWMGGGGGGGGGFQPPGLFSKGFAGSTADLQIVFLEPLNKMCADILLTVCHNRCLYLLFFVYQKIFSVVL